MADNPAGPGPTTSTNIPPQPQPTAPTTPPPKKLDVEKIKTINKSILYISAGIGIVLIMLGVGYYLGLSTGTHAAKTSTTVQASSISTTTTTISNVSNQNTTVSTTTITAPTNYNTTFIGLCLPNGEKWSVTLTNSIANDNWTENSTIDVLTFSRPAGTYVYTAHIDPSEGYIISSNVLANYTGNVTIYPNSNGVAGLGTLTQLTFLRTSRYYNMTFRESGLAKGDRWGIKLNYTYTPCTNLDSVQSYYTSNDVVSFKFQNGSLAYTIYPFAGYTATPDSGNFEITKNVTIPITFK